MKNFIIIAIIALVILEIVLVIFDRPLFCQLEGFGGIGKVPAFCLKYYLP